MAQIFVPRVNLALKIILLGGAGAITVLLLVYRLNVRADAPDLAPIEQPIPFSHKHHVGDDGIDCRYCHASVEYSAFAGVPPLATCMTCHSQLFTQASVLAPLLQAYREGRPLKWRRVHDLPDFVYFDHSIHIAKGVGCVTCHGRVDQMPLTWRTVSLDMQWCLQCHRHPDKYLRPREHVFDMAWQPSGDQRSRGRQLMQMYRVRSAVELTQCSICHR